MAHLVTSELPLTGLSWAPAAARFLAQHMIASMSDQVGVHAFVTHDLLVTATVAQLHGEPYGQEHWPHYLEAAFVWLEAGKVQCAYRDVSRSVGTWPLCGLDERNVIDFARREIARTVGLDCSARFSLAGGAFKTLLTGRSPRDLDLWAPSPADRTALVGALEKRGAIHLGDGPFSDRLEIAERVVEIPRKVEPPTLEGRLARFDIALSAVGVEHRGGDEWAARIHPQAVASVARREVLLLEPLVNWRYALTTLERVRRYADELGYAVPAGVESAVWQVFDAQTPDVRAAMLARHASTTVGAFGVAEEAACRSP